MLTFGLAVLGDEPSDALLERVRRVDDGNAFSRLWVADERFRRDVWVTLGLLGATTSRVELGTCVTDPFIRHPALTATAIATLDEATGGRAILGLGAGASGFGTLRIARPTPATALRETIELSRRMWSSASAFTYEGRQVSFHDGRLGFLPRRAVPIHLAGRGPRILNLAGKLADGAIVASFVDGPLLDRSLALVAEGEAQRSPDLGPLERVSWVYMSVDDDQEAARHAVRRGVAVALWGSRPILDELSIRLPAPLVELMDSTTYSLEPEVIDRAAPLVPDELIDQCSVAGTPTECAAKLRRLATRGFDHVACWLFPTGGTALGPMTQALADHVIPAVRAGLHDGSME